MKKFQILLTLILIFFSLSAFGAEPNWVAKFLDRYRPTPILLSRPPASQVNPALLQGNSASVALDDVIRLMLESNLNISVDRLSPQIAQFLIDTYRLPFDPTMHITAS